MSTLIVPVAKITAVKPHSNADRLAVAEVLGWQVVTGKDEFKVGDRVVYIPPDAILPVELSDTLGVTQYLSKGRVRQVKLRGEPSFGFVVPVEKAFFASFAGKKNPEDLLTFLEVQDSQNLANFLGITKYEPPLRATAGDAETSHPLFDKFTEVENFRHYPDIISEGENVVITEKIHGTNCRIGSIEGEIMAGSMEVRRKRPELKDMESNIYWFPFTISGVRRMLAQLSRDYKQVILYGEVYGKVQSLHYDKPNQLGFRAFALKVDGKYLNYDEFLSRMETYYIPAVPTLYRGEFKKDLLKSLTNQNSVLANDQIMEGVVIQPACERNDPKIGRVILKYLSEAYLFSKGVSDFKDV